MRTRSKAETKAQSSPEPSFAPMRSGWLQRSSASHAGPVTSPPIVHDVLRSPGQPLALETRASMEHSFGHDFSRVRVHTHAKAAESARAVNARAFTVGRDVVFGAGQYAPGTSEGRRLMAHELAHVVQQTSFLERRLQPFTAEIGGSNNIYIKPEKGDNDADLNRVLCTKVKKRKIAGRKEINVTECLPKGTIKAMGLGPYTCVDFVRSAIGEKPKTEPDYDWFITSKLWKELLKSGYRIRGFGVIKEDGRVEAAEGLSWKQLNPRIGDLVFMKGDVKLLKGEEPNPKGDNFIVTWDHVGFFIVRSLKGFDYHLAKDGDENPIGIYHTGSESSEQMAPGAYVKGSGSLLAYLGVLESEKKITSNK